MNIEPVLSSFEKFYWKDCDNFAYFILWSHKKLIDKEYCQKLWPEEEYTKDEPDWDNPAESFQYHWRRYRHTFFNSTLAFFESTRQANTLRLYYKYHEETGKSYCTKEDYRI